ncbi:hypothetical protein ACFWID_33550, partial [Streptomyces sp. NPDC127040]
MSSADTPLPAVAPEVLAEAVENLTARLRKKLDAATASCGAAAVRAPDGSVGIRFGEDAVVTLRPGAEGTLTRAEQAVCSCLLAPRCLHRAAALGAAPLADAPPAVTLPADAPLRAPGAPAGEPAPTSGPRAAAPRALTCAQTAAAG